MPYALDHALRVIATIGPVVIIAWVVARMLVPERNAPKRLLIALLAAFVTACATGGALGIVGALSFRGYLLLLGPLAAGTVLVWRRRRSREASLPRAETDASRPVAITLVLAAFVSFGALAAKLADGIPEHDELTYHLFFPTQWLADQRMSLIDTPFGDAAPAYAPAAGALWYAWLMAPMAGPIPGDPSLDSLVHGGIGTIAKIGQFPFLLLLGAGLTVLARRLGATSLAYLPAALLPFMPLVLRQAASASVDLMMAGFLIAALALIREYQATGSRVDACAAGLSLGLACSVKFVALAYAPFVLIPAAFAWVERKRPSAAVAFLIAAIAAGSPWYLRNLFLTGNPVFPADVSIFGRTIFPGAYTRQAMTESVFYVSDPGAIGAVAIGTVGFWFAIVCGAAIIAAFFLAWRSPAWRSLAWIAPCVIIWHFAVVPYNTQVRFLIWVAALTLLPLSLWPETRTGRRSLAAVLALLIGVSLLGPRVSFQIGPIRVASIGLLNLKALRTGSAGFVFPLNRISAADLEMEGYLRLLQTRPKTVAYSGRNTPYFLAGSEGRTRVSYVNIDGQTDKHLHDYHQEAAASGRLDKTGTTPEWARGRPDFDAWRNALRKGNVDYLFVESMADDNTRQLSPDADGFPIERAWARDHPNDFTVVAKGARWELYDVRFLRSRNGTPDVEKSMMSAAPMKESASADSSGWPSRVK